MVSITQAEFEEEAKAFAAACSDASMCQQWEWVSQDAGDVRFVNGCGGYLRLKGVARKACTSESEQPAADTTTDPSDDLDLEEEVEEDDVSTLPPDAASSLLHVYEYHAVYSSAFGVPVLYLRGRESSGALLRPHDVWRDLCGPQADRFPPPPDAAKARNDWLSDSGLPTPAEHPVTGEAFLMVHPCRTKDFMACALPFKLGEHGKAAAFGGARATSRYLLMWLTVFGGAVGVRVPPVVINKLLSSSTSSLHTCV